MSLELPKFDRNNFPDISGAFNDGVNWFKEQTTATQAGVVLAAGAALLALSGTFYAIVKAIKNRNVTQLDPEAQKNEVATISADSQKKVDGVAADFKKLEAIQKAAVEKEAYAAKNPALNGTDGLADKAKDILEVLKANADKANEAVGIVKDHVEAAKAQMEIITEQAAKYNTEGASNSDKQKAFTALKAAQASLDVIVNDANEAGKEVLEADAKAKRIAEAEANRAKKAADAKLASELEFTPVNFVKQNQTTLVAGTAVAGTGYMLGAAGVATAYFSLPFVAAAGLGTLAVAGVKSAINHMNAPKTA